ncbi:MAG: ATP-binding protein, partial [Mangrovibacterium sp.]
MIKKIITSLNVFRNEDMNIKSKLSHIRNQWTLLADSSGIGLWYYDYQNKLLVWDENSRAILAGKDKLASIDIEYLKKRVHPDDIHFFLSEMNKMKEKDYGLTVNFRIIRSDESIRNVKLHGMAERNKKGELTKIIGISYDVTEYVQAKNDYMKLKTQLLRANKMESLGNLAAGIAHDFNNMLAVIVGSLELATIGTDIDHQTVRHLKNIRTAAEKSAELTRQLLAYSRQQNVEPKVLDINSSIEKALTILKRILTKEIDLIWEPGKGLMPVKIDPSQVDQLLTNLCINSRDAINGPGKIIIETNEAILDEMYCEMHAGATPGKYVTLSVSDNGHGIDKKLIKRIFEPFFTTKELGKGTGLGLATVYGIVKQNK